MALKPSDRYPAQTDADPDYPQGKARNAGSFQDGTGTPLERDWINDLWGFQQALLDAAGTTPSGNPDKVGASDYLAAVRHVANEATERLLLAHWSVADDAAPTNAITWSTALGLFVAVGAGGAIKTSPDGNTWTTRTSDVSASLNGVASSPAGVLVAVGASGTVTQSEDGITWAEQSSGVATGFSDVVWHVDTFVALGTAIRTSPDGLAWTARASTGVGGHIATNGTDRVIMIATTGGTGWTSPDGITWTEHTITTLEFIHDVTWSAALRVFVAVGSAGYIYTSPTGITWTERASGSPDLYAVTATDNYVVAVGDGDTVLVSRDGLTWREVAHDIAELGIGDIAWSGFVCVSIGGSAGEVSRSMARLPL